MSAKETELLNYTIHGIFYFLDSFFSFKMMNNKFHVNSPNLIKLFMCELNLHLLNKKYYISLFPYLKFYTCHI